jgi:Zn finger protein HypA/HybF involved in hydrogenase expression
VPRVEVGKLRRLVQVQLNHEQRTRPSRRWARIECVEGPSLAVEVRPGEFKCARCHEPVSAPVTFE